MFCFKLPRTWEKKWRGTPWTFVWILNVVKNIAQMKVTVIMIMREMRAMPRPVAERSPWKRCPNTMRDQSMRTFCVLCIVQESANMLYCRSSALSDCICWAWRILPVLFLFSSRKSKKKRSRSSSSSTSSSSESQKEDLFPGKSNPEDKSFHKPRLNESPVERGKPRGGIVSLSTDAE